MLGQVLLFAMIPKDIVQMLPIVLMLHLTVPLYLSLQHNVSQIKPPMFARVFLKVTALVLQTKLLACTLQEKQLPARTNKQIVLNFLTKIFAKISQLAHGVMSTSAQLKQHPHPILTL